MAWRETCVMDERMCFVATCLDGRENISEVCRHFGISRKTGHKYLERYEREGPPGLSERSRRPKSCPFTTNAVVEQLILKERRKHPTWGPKKIHDLLLKMTWEELSGTNDR